MWARIANPRYRVVTFDPKADKSSPTLDEKTGNVSEQNRPNQIGFGHELIHADHINNGDVDLTPQNFTYQNENGKETTENVRSEELRTVGLQGVKPGDVTENDLRNEQHVKQRGAY